MFAHSLTDVVNMIFGFFVHKCKHHRVTHTHTNQRERNKNSNRWQNRNDLCDCAWTGVSSCNANKSCAAHCARLVTYFWYCRIHFTLIPPLYLFALGLAKGINYITYHLPTRCWAVCAIDFGNAFKLLYSNHQLGTFAKLIESLIDCDECEPLEV